MSQNGSDPIKLEVLVAQFQARELPKVLWTHVAHIQVAFWYNWHYPYSEALQQVRTGITAYNEAVGTPNTDESGYHETLTVYWMRISRAFLKRGSYKNAQQACDAFLLTEAAAKTSPFSFYTKEVLFSKRARQQWVDGDLQAVPEPVL